MNQHGRGPYVRDTDEGDTRQVDTGGAERETIRFAKQFEPFANDARYRCS